MLLIFAVFYRLIYESDCGVFSNNNGLGDEFGFFRNLFVDLMVNCLLELSEFKDT